MHLGYVVLIFCRVVAMYLLYVAAMPFRVRGMLAWRFIGNGNAGTITAPVRPAARHLFQRRQNALAP